MDPGYNLTMNQTCPETLAARIEQAWAYARHPQPHLEGAPQGGQGLLCPAFLESWDFCPFGRNGTPLASTKGELWPPLPSAQQGRDYSCFLRGRKAQLGLRAANRKHGSCPLCPQSEPASQFPRIPESLGSAASKLWNRGAPPAEAPREQPSETLDQVTFASVLPLSSAPRGIASPRKALGPKTRRCLRR